jgi:T5SS/PEP-CTERM-associated repeat protein
LGTLNVSDAESTLTVTEFISVGRFGSGSMTVSDGGSVTAGTNLVISDQASSDGMVLVTGSGSTVAVTNNLLIGNNAAGEMSLVNGGSVTVDGDTTVRNASTLAIAGGTLTTGLFDAADAASTASFTLAANGETGGIFATNADVSGTILDLVLGHQPNMFDVFVLLDLDPNNSITGTFSYLGNPVNEGDLLTVTTGSFSQEFEATYTYNGSSFALTAIPEPGGISMIFGFGLLALAHRRRC